MTDNRRDFFISFNSVDLAYAEAIDAALREAGFTTFFHPRDVRPGENVPLWMQDALVNSTQTLALYSPDYIADRAVYSLAEVLATWWQDPSAKVRGLIPVVLRDIDFSKRPLVAMLSRIDLQGLTAREGADELVKQLKSRDETGQREVAKPGINLPRVFQVLSRSNPNFSGRFEALDRLQKSLSIGNAAVTAVAGLGGLGKTTLVAEYCHRFHARYDGVWWIRAEQESVMLNDIVALGQLLNVVRGENVEQDARVTLGHLSSLVERWLLVYDNAPNPDAISKWLPGERVRCIITSRRSDFDAMAQVTPLDQWTEQSTTEYLLARTGRSDKVGATRLAKTLGGLPLAAEQAAVFLRNRMGISFDDYHDEIARVIKLPRPKGSTGNYPETVYAAFAKSIEAIDLVEGGPAALDLLRLCSFLSPDGVDVGLMTYVRAELGFPAHFASIMQGKFLREDVFAILVSLSLLKVEAGPHGTTLIIHRLLLEVMRDMIGDDGRELWGTLALRLIDGAFPNNPMSPSSWSICSNLIAHIGPLDLHLARTPKTNRPLSRLFHQSAIYLHVRGEYEAALRWSESAVQSMRKTRADEPLVIAASLGLLASCCVSLDKLSEAESAFLEALEIEERLLGSNNSEVAMTLSNIAQIYWIRQDYEKAEEQLRKVTDIMLASHGPESLKYGVALSNLGAVYGAWARQTNQESLRSKEKETKIRAHAVTLAANGVRDPDTAMCLNNLCAMYEEFDDSSMAMREMEQSVGIMISLGLAKHPQTQRRLAILALRLRESGQLERSNELLRDDFSSLKTNILQLEADHRAWVAQQPNTRQFGPPSPITGATK